MALPSLQCISQPMLPVQMGDWLAENREAGQTFDEYLKSFDSLPLKKPIVIYLYPLFASSKFTDQHFRTLVNFLADYFSASVRVAERQADAKFKQCDEYRNDIGHGRRAFAKELLHLVRGTPSEPLNPDGFAHILLTDYDLWCERNDPDDWVFGLAEEDHRAIVSTARLFSTDATESVALTRSLKIVTHEVGHTLHLGHCTSARCNMNGKNSIEELDRHPLELCPSCLQKFHFISNFEPPERLSRLIAALETMGADLTHDYFYPERDCLNRISGVSA